MKVGDLVTMPNAGGIDDDMSCYDARVVGVVARMPPVGNDGEVRRDRGTPKVLVIWADGGGMGDWEPMDWLKVVSEG